MTSLAIGYRRIQNILRQRHIATMRILEQKISDAGPSSQRVEPHVLSSARKMLEEDGVLVRVDRATGRWYRLTSTPESVWMRRLAKIEPILKRMQDGANHRAVGQTLEIAVYRALLAERSGLLVLGGFVGLDGLDPQGPRKVEPPSMINGNSLSGGKSLDFILVHSEAGAVGIEVKNTREWLYPRAAEIREFLHKCCELDAVPVMICRRYAYATYSVLYRCGVLLHENYNQLMPESLRDLVKKARDKDLLGYHDIRVSDEPDSRLRNFVGQSLPRLLPEARNRFSKYKNLVCRFASESVTYEEFVGRSKRRELNLDEDSGGPLPD